MAFNVLEWSLFNGKPQRLYRFVIGPLILGYTSHDKAVVHNNLTYQPAQIKDDGIRQKGEQSSDRLKISVPFDFEPARLFLAGRPTITVTLWDKHAGDDEARVIWHGELMEINQKNAASMELYCRPLGTRPMTGLSLSWSRECPHTLYDKNCTVRPEDYQAPFTVQSVHGRELVAQSGLSSYADGWFKGGYIRWQTAQGLVFTRGIAQHKGNTLTLINPAPLTFGQPCFALAGCNGLIQTCHEKFNNLDNCGACPHMPGKSPFDGEPVF